MTKETLKNELQANLKQLLHGVTFNVEPLPPDLDPLLVLLTMNKHVIGFGALTTSPIEEYRLAYDKFKSLYSSKTKEWAGLDFDLVLCNESKNGDYDEFFSSIEINPYFCRKYVVDTRENLALALSRLPFIPLSADIIETTTGRERQVSCQTYLMRNGVNTNLARYLTVPYSRSEEGIVNECLSGNLGEPIWQKAKLEETVPTMSYSGQAVRLKKIEITGFRAYRTFQEFDLDADLVVLYGPNGYGKTSFYDAIDFAATGSILRFDERYQRKGKDLAKVLKNLDSDDNQSKVRLLATTPDAEIDIVRDVGTARADASLNGQTATRTEILLRLCGLARDPDLRIENLVRLFRGTHIFGQDSQALTSMMAQSILPEDTVTRMLALQDYVEAISKSNKVTVHIANSIRNYNYQIDQLRLSIESKRKEVETLQKTARITEARTDSTGMVGTIKDKIEKALNVPLSLHRDTILETIQDWRILLVSEISLLSEKRKLTEEILPKSRLLYEGREKFEKINRESQERDSILKGLSDSLLAQKQLLGQYEQEMESTVKAADNNAATSKNLRWLFESRPHIDDVRNRLTEINKSLRATTTRFNNQRVEIDEGNQRIQSLEKRIEIIRTRLKTAEARRDMIREFQSRLSDWKGLLAKKNSLQTQLVHLKEKQTGLTKDIRLRKRELNAESINAQKLSRKLKALQSSQTSLTSLLDQLEPHITTGQCPVCGTVHASANELREKLRRQKGHQSTDLKETMSTYESSLKQIDKLTERLQKLEDKLVQVEGDINDGQAQAQEIDAQTKWFVDVAEKLEISLETNNLNDICVTKATDTDLLIEKENKNLVEKKDELKKERNVLADLLAREAPLEKELGNIRAEKKRLEMQEHETVEEALSRKVAIDLSSEKVELESKELALQQESFAKKIVSLEAVLAKTKDEINDLEHKKRSAEKEVSDSQKLIQDHESLREEVAAKLRTLQVSETLSIDEVKDFLKQISDRIELLESILSEVISIAIAIDSSQKAVVLARLENDLTEEEKKLGEIKQSLARFGNWNSYFSQISNELNSVQNRALSEYVRFYGPLASTIQRRLRSFYGYGDVRLSPSKHGIQVFIDHGGKKDLPPSDYLSQSQIQIIMLSLFLSATLTQNWSRFSPIMLDDPVTHFDDLNSYSFMDLTAGLVNKSDARHQIIISTCEDRLFRLMKQKFDRLEKKVIYHVFESFGESGPKVTSLSN